MNTDETTHDRALTIHLGRAGRKCLRVDRLASLGLGADAPAGNGRPGDDSPEGPGLLAVILKAIRSEPANRRHGYRHQAAGRVVWVGWWKGDDFGAVSGHVRDIGRGGARVVLGRRPPRRQPVWLYKEVDDTLACVRGEVVGHTPAPAARYDVRFRFASPCPTVLLQAVVCDPPAV